MTKSSGAPQYLDVTTPMKKLLLASLLIVGCDTDENIAFTGSGHGPVSVGATRWAVSLGGTQGDHAWSVAVDTRGDVVAVGTAESNPVDFGSGPVMVPRAGWYHSFVTKRDASDGAERWTRAMIPMTEASLVDALGVATTPGDDVVVIGTYRGTVDFGGQTLTVSELPEHIYDGFVAKYAPDGALRWVHGVDADADVWLRALAVDSTGQIYVTGGFSGTIDLAGQSVTSHSPNGFDGVLAAYDPAGNMVWGAAFPGSAEQVSQDIGIAENGDIVVVGQFRGAASFGGPTYQATALTGFLTRYRSDGLYLSSRALANANSLAQVSKVAFRGSQTIIQYGHDVPGQSGDSILEALDPANTSLWSQSIANQSDGPPYRTLAATDSGLLVSIAINNTLRFDADPTTNHSQMEVVTFDEDGTGGRVTMWLTTGGNASVSDTAVGPGDSIAFAGSLAGSCDFGGAPVHTSGLQDGNAVIIVTEPSH